MPMSLAAQAQYQRGWGLQYGSLREKVLKDPLYKEAFAASHDRTIMSHENRMNIFLLLRFFIGKIAFGNIVEYGAYRGGNAIFMAHVVRKLYPGVFRGHAANRQESR